MAQRDECPVHRFRIKDSRSAYYWAMMKPYVPSPKLYGIPYNGPQESDIETKCYEVIHFGIYHALYNKLMNFKFNPRFEDDFPSETRANSKLVYSYSLYPLGKEDSSSLLGILT